MDEDLLKALLKKAAGYSHDEVQEEYSVTPEGEMVLVKRKVTSKYYPPDGGALKTYLELASDNGAEDMDDAALEEEKRRLLKELAAEEKKARRAGRRGAEGEGNVET